MQATCQSLSCTLSAMGPQHGLYQKHLIPALSDMCRVPSMITLTFLNVMKVVVMKLLWMLNVKSGKPVCLNLSLLLFNYTIENLRPSKAIQACNRHQIRWVCI